MKANHEPLTPYEAAAILRIHPRMVFKLLRTSPQFSTSTAAKRSQMVGGSQSIRKSSLSG